MGSNATAPQAGTAPKERPILFSGPMVRAIQAGTKTQTRRPLGVQPLEILLPRSRDARALARITRVLNGRRAWFYLKSRNPNRGGACYCRHGEIGDRLWVRESFRLRADQDHKPPSQDWWKSGAWYEADEPNGIVPSGCGGGAGKLRPSIFMPRVFSRILLELTDVRLERVQDINEADAKAEGIQYDAEAGRCPWSPDWDEQRRRQQDRNASHARADPLYYYGHGTARHAFGDLWDSINLKRGFGWDVNPYVWCLTFQAGTAPTRGVV